MIVNTRERSNAKGRGILYFIRKNSLVNLTTDPNLWILVLRRRSYTRNHFDLGLGTPGTPQRPRVVEATRNVLIVDNRDILLKSIFIRNDK